ncbi:hypothetical protein [Herbihabitans rhizosphaerae]|uniref:hypothetical protein n=1 Tax=Herbihabitans rhizosphaerae TaxID=1872711 RepID=UPI001F5F651F|nr:hypothetical protein [Herbihabitans rhizosphaerae]
MLLIVLWLWRASTRRARAAADAARAGGRLFSLTGRVVVGAVLIAGVQWLALSHPGSGGAVKVAALVVPALLCSWVLVKALTITTIDSRPNRRAGRRGGGRR